MRRAVTQVITPGIILEEEQLEPKAGHYLAAVCFGDRQAGEPCAGIAHVDVSTGEFSATLVPAADASEELGRIAPAELLVVTPDASVTSGDRGAAWASATRAGRAEPKWYAARRCRDAVRAVHPPSPRRRCTRWSHRPPRLCIRYAQATQPTGTLPIFALRTYQPGDSLIVDETTRTNLELLHTLIEHKRQGALIGVLDQTKTAMGGRLLRRWLLSPLMSLGAIRRRHDAVEWLVEHQLARQALRERLAEIYDIERLAGRLGRGSRHRAICSAWGRA